MLSPHDDWWDCVYDNAIEDGLSKGFEIIRINFSGFYSQGDGASWTGSVDAIKWLELNKPIDPLAHIMIALIEDEWIERRLAITKSNSRYEHSNTMVRDDWYRTVPVVNAEHVISSGMFEGAGVNNLLESLPDSYLDELADEILQSAREYADDIYIQLRKEYEWLTSEECLIEMCEANEYLFDKTGRFV